MHLNDPFLNGNLPLLYPFIIESSVSDINKYHIGLYRKGNSDTKTLSHTPFLIVV